MMLSPDDGDPSEVAAWLLAAPIWRGQDEAKNY